MYYNKSIMPSETDTGLDTFTLRRNKQHDVELGSISRAWLSEYERLKQTYPGFVGYLIKIAKQEGQEAFRVPYLQFKQEWESHVFSTPARAIILDVWRDRFANDTDQDTVALGLTQHNALGHILSDSNLFLSALPRVLLSKRQRGGL